MNSRGEKSVPAVLVLDCSTARGSVALATGGGAVWWSAEFGAGRGRGGELFLALEEALRQAAKAREFEEAETREFEASLRALSDGGNTEELVRPAGESAARPGLLSEIVVGLGPGSYSGVRQAIAAANGLAAATGARLSGFASPLALGTNEQNFHTVGDARRGAFYHTAVEAGVCVQGPELVDDLAALQTRLAARPDWPVLAVENLPPGLPPETPVAWPSAWRLPISSRAARREPPLEPIYLRPVSITLPKAR